MKFQTRFFIISRDSREIYAIGQPHHRWPITKVMGQLCQFYQLNLEIRENYVKINDYAMFHPSGAIGRSITLKVLDLMRTGERLAAVHPGTLVRDALIAMTKARNGAVAITDGDDKLLGIFTDGDFRRKITDNPDILIEKIENVMTTSPISINQNKLAIEIMKILEKRKIDDVPAIDDDGRLTGMVDIQDLPKFKMM